MERKRFELFLAAARRVDRGLGLDGPLLLARVAAACGMTVQEARTHLDRAILERIAFRAGTARMGEFYLEEEATAPI